jgi:hypothetical protein
MHWVPHGRLGEQSLPDRNAIFMRPVDRIGERYHFFKTLKDAVSKPCAQRWRLALTFVISSRSLLFSFSKMALSSVLMIVCAGWLSWSPAMFGTRVEPAHFFWDA